MYIHYVHFRNHRYECKIYLVAYLCCDSELGEHTFQQLFIRSNPVKYRKFSGETLMKFQPGESGNPTGRPRGSMNKHTQLAKLLEPRAEELINKMVELALNGDSNALRLCIERLLPKARADGLNVSFPEFETNNHNSSIEVATEIVNNVLTGDVTPDQGKKLIELIEEHRKRIDHEKFSIKLGF